MLPPSKDGSGQAWSPESVAQALTLFKAILGTGGPALLQSAKQQQPDLLSEVQKKLQQLEQYNQGGSSAKRPSS